jgi:hypothetical protein
LILLHRHDFELSQDRKRLGTRLFYAAAVVNHKTGTFFLVFYRHLGIQPTASIFDRDAVSPD